MLLHGSEYESVLDVTTNDAEIAAKNDVEVVEWEVFEHKNLLQSNFRGMKPHFVPWSNLHKYVFLRERVT